MFAHKFVIIYKPSMYTLEFRQEYMGWTIWLEAFYFKFLNTLHVWR